MAKTESGKVSSLSAFIVGLVLMLIFLATPLAVILYISPLPEYLDITKKNESFMFSMGVGLLLSVIGAVAFTARAVSEKKPMSRKGRKKK